MSEKARYRQKAFRGQEGRLGGIPLPQFKGTNFKDEKDKSSAFTHNNFHRLVIS